MKKIIAFVLFFAFSLPAAPALAASGQGNEGMYVSCHVCGLCPAPLGICIFYYAIAVLIILIGVLLFRNRSKKCPLCKTKCSRSVQICGKCGYDFASGLQSTLTIRVEDSPELLALRNNKNDSAEQNAAAAEVNQQPTSEKYPPAQNKEMPPVPDSAKEFAYEVIKAAPATSETKINSIHPVKPEPDQAPAERPASKIAESLINGNTVPIVLDTFKKRPAKYSPLEEAPAPKLKEPPVFEPEPPALPASVEKYMINTETAAAQQDMTETPASKNCPFCDAELHPKALFCGKCGHKLTN